MGAYYNAGGGCFEGNCLVRMHDDTKTKVKDIKKGDLVRSWNGELAKVLAIVKIFSSNKSILMVEFE